MSGIAYLLLLAGVLFLFGFQSGVMAVRQHYSALRQQDESRIKGLEYELDALRRMRRQFDCGW
jgi:hypothetical protein